MSNAPLRGVQVSDHGGGFEFNTIFRKHNTNRVNHQHLFAQHINSTILANCTSSGGTIKYIGQLFFDTALRAEVMAIYSYNANTLETISNDDDMLASVVASVEYE